MQRTPQQIIADPGVSEADLVDAIAQLGAVTEPASFWARLANDSHRSPTQRRLYIFQLFHRHVRPGMSLSQLALILDKPAWLTREVLEMIEDLGGTIPVRLTDDNTVFVLRVSPECETSPIWAVYVSVTGKHSANELYALLHGNAVDARVAQARILQIGFSPPVHQSAPTTRLSGPEPR